MWHVRSVKNDMTPSEYGCKCRTACKRVSIACARACMFPFQPGPWSRPPADNTLNFSGWLRQISKRYATTCLIPTDDWTLCKTCMQTSASRTVHPKSLALQLCLVVPLSNGLPSHHPWMTTNVEDRPSVYWKDALLPTSEIRGSLPTKDTFPDVSLHVCRQLHCLFDASLGPSIQLCCCA